MKTLAFILAVATATLVVICVLQGRKMTEQKTQLVSARKDIEQYSAEVEELRAAQEQARKQRDDLLHQSNELADQLRTRPLAASPSAAETPTNSVPNAAEPAGPRQDTAGFGKVLSKMMQDPEMKKFMRAQQRAMVEQI